jgi:hypothetical protein
MKHNKALALPILLGLNGSENWTAKSEDKSKLTAVEMRFIQKLQSMRGGEQN